ncbi:hypothetical protein J1C73_07040 [Streptomyces laculatispora]|nr:hypothetical protein [Streptomyces laculatispora]MBO0914081.1 hypothetical protein [Streptomyces laculatispora]
MAQRHLGALGLVLNAAVGELRALPVEERKHDVLDEDVARFFPLKHADLNVLGRYSFRAFTSVDGGVRARCATRVRRSWTRTTTAGRSKYQELTRPGP